MGPTVLRGLVGPIIKPATCNFVRQDKELVGTLNPVWAGRKSSVKPTSILTNNDNKKSIELLISLRSHKIFCCYYFCMYVKQSIIILH